MVDYLWDSNMVRWEVVYDYKLSDDTYVCAKRVEAPAFPFTRKKTRDKTPPWVEGLRMIKEGEKKWKAELETRRRGTRG